MLLRKTWREDLMRSFRNKIGNPMTDYPFYMKGRDDVIFVHIPKTAGTSIRHSYEINRPRGYLNDPAFVKHLTTREIISFIGDDHFEACFSFAFVRNPWERFYSWYRFVYRKNRNGMADRKMTFEAFVDDCFSKSDYVYGGSPAFLKSQLYWLSDDQNNVRVKYIGRYERLAQDYDHIAKKIGITTPLAQRNRATPVDYREAYDARLRKIIATQYHDDIDFFKYTFDGV